MSDTNLSPDATSASQGGSDNKRKASAASSEKDTFMGVTLKGWAISAVSAVAVLTAAGGGCITLYSKYQSINTTVRQQTGVLVDQSNQLQAIASDTSARMSEAEKHRRNGDRFETVPILTDNGSENVMAEYYPSDGCVHISRKPPDASDAKPGTTVEYGNLQDVWIPDPNRQAAVQSGETRPPAPLDLGAQALGRAAAEIQRHADILKQAGIRRDISYPKPRLKRVATVPATCINPHPGKFTVRNVQINACSVQVWRTFADGCIHNQMYNACNGQWDPKINWTSCVAQHHP